MLVSNKYKKSKSRQVGKKYSRHGTLGMRAGRCTLVLCTRDTGFVTKFGAKGVAAPDSARCCAWRALSFGMARLFALMLACPMWPTTCFHAPAVINSHNFVVFPDIAVFAHTSTAVTARQGLLAWPGTGKGLVIYLFETGKAQDMSASWDCALDLLFANDMVRVLCLPTQWIGELMSAIKVQHNVFESDPASIHARIATDPGTWMVAAL